MARQPAVGWGRDWFGFIPSEHIYLREAWEDMVEVEDTDLDPYRPEMALEDA